MKRIPRFQNPIALKRLRRFRGKKRAYVSLWILAMLYGISLFSEWICNDRPLYVRFRGQSYFPALRYYPERVFIDGGRDTRPNYKSLSASPAFREDPANGMIWAPVPFGPDESIDPQSLRGEDLVTVRLTPIPFVGHIDITPDLTIVRALSCGSFFATNDPGVAGLNVAAAWELPESFRRGIAARFRNQAAGRLSASLRRQGPEPMDADVSLSAFTPRSQAPATVRLTFRRSPPGSARTQSMTVNRNGAIAGTPPAAWAGWPESVRTALLAQARQAFDGPLYPEAMTDGHTAYQVDIRRNEVSWPHPPTRGHWMGIDSAGRDVFARILYGLRTSMTFGFLLVILSYGIGIVVGAVQGYFGGRLDITGQRLIEIWSALPFLYVMILMGSVFGQRFSLLLFCYGLFNWIGLSYYIRAEFLRLRGLPFVEAAKCMGMRPSRIIFRHVLPNALTPVVTFFPFSLVGAMGSLAALDYLGFGLPPPTASWGELLHQAQQFRWAWWLILYPSLALFVVMLLGVFVGEGVREAYDPQRFSNME